MVLEGMLVEFLDSECLKELSADFAPAYKDESDRPSVFSRLFISISANLLSSSPRVCAGFPFPSLMPETTVCALGDILPHNESSFRGHQWW